MDKMIMVSIVCNTYNHEKYIAKTIDSFLEQETEFEYEILIHDDASTDSTADIVREYEKKYPDIVKPIYQSVNQHSQGVKILPINIARAKGKYLALCEGDDYWCDPHKLAKQVSYMEEHKDCTFCCTNGYEMEGGEIVKKTVPVNHVAKKHYKGDVNAIYTMEELVLLGSVSLATYLIPRKVYDNFVKLSKSAFTGDIYYKLASTAQGYAYYFSDCTCVYRRGVPGSMTTQWRWGSKEKYIKMLDKYINFYEEFDAATEYICTKALNYNKMHYLIEKAISSENYKEARKWKYFKYAWTKGREYWSRYIMKVYLHSVYSWLKKIKKKHVKTNLF